MSQITNFYSSSIAPSFKVKERIQTGGNWYIQKARQENLLNLRVNRSLTNDQSVICDTETRVNSGTLIRLMWESQRMAS